MYSKEASVAPCRKRLKVNDGVMSVGGGMEIYIVERVWYSIKDWLGVVCSCV